MSFSLTRIILFVQDVELLKNFYQQHFSLQPTEETKGEWTVLKAGACELALHKIGTDVVIDPQNKPGLTNTKLVFETTEELHQLWKRLQNDGAKVGEVKSFVGQPYLFLDGTDPEGNVFQLMQRVG